MSKKPKCPQLIAFEKSLYEKDICNILSGIARRELVFNRNSTRVRREGFMEESMGMMEKINKMTEDEFVAKILDEGKRIEIHGVQVIRRKGGTLDLILRTGDNAYDLRVRKGCYYWLDSKTVDDLTRELHRGEEW